MIVLDSRAYVEALTRPVSDPLRQRIAGLSLVHVPDGFDVEVLNILRRLCLRGALGVRRAATEVVALSSWGDVERHSVVPLLADMWRLRANVTGYDAAYVALAARLAIPLVTTDAHLARSPGLPCEVELS